MQGTTYGAQRPFLRIDTDVELLYLTTRFCAPNNVNVITQSGVHRANVRPCHGGGLGPNERESEGVEVEQEMTANSAIDGIAHPHLFVICMIFFMLSMTRPTILPYQRRKHEEIARIVERDKSFRDAQERGTAQRRRQACRSPSTTSWSRRRRRHRREDFRLFGFRWTRTISLRNSKQPDRGITQFYLMF